MRMLRMLDLVLGKTSCPFQRLWVIVMSLASVLKTALDMRHAVEAVLSTTLVDPSGLNAEESGEVFRSPQLRPCLSH